VSATIVVGILKSDWLIFMWKQCDYTTSSQKLPMSLKRVGKNSAALPL
jgi:hypothetical protein